jgi:hypothetical protein
MSDTWSHRDEAGWSEGAVVGYDVEAVDGSIGKVDQATAETGRAHIVIDTGHWIFGKKRLIPAGLVTAVDHETRTLRLSLSKDQIRAAPDYEAELDDESRQRHSEHYDPYAG